MEDSYASSVLASLTVEAQEDGKVLVDATPLVLRDAGNLEGTLRRTNQGTFRLDQSRSLVNLSRTKAFPKNTDVDVWLTFASDSPGPIISRVAPDGRSVTYGMHHSFVEPPDDGYKPRRADPRMAVGGLSFVDLSKSFSEAPEERWVRRFRLVKRNPAAAVSDPVTQIVYYVDPAIPEPFRSASKAGILWWNKAFEAAGFSNAIRVADPGPRSIRSTHGSPTCCGPIATSAASRMAARCPILALARFCRPSRAWTRIVSARLATTGTPIVPR